MLSKFDTSAFGEMLDQVKGSVPSNADGAFLREGVPVLCINFFDGCNMTAEAHNSQSSLYSNSFSVECDQDVKIDIPASWIMSAIVRAPGKESSLEIKNDNEIEFKSGRFKTSSEYFLYNYDKVRKEGVSDEEKIFDYELDKDRLLGGLQYTSSFMAKDDVRYYLNGVAFDVVNGNLRIVGTNGHILGLYEYGQKSAIDENLKCCPIIPNASVVEAIRFLKASSHQSVRVVFDSYGISFSGTGNAKFFSLLINGNYADWEKVPNSLSINHTFKVSRNDMIQAVDRVKSVSKSKSHASVDLIIDSEEPNVITIKLVEDSGLSKRKASEKIPVSFEEEMTMDLRVDSEYLYKIFSATPDDEISIGFNGPEDKIKISPIKTNDYLGIMVPVRRNHIQ